MSKTGEVSVDVKSYNREPVVAYTKEHILKFINNSEPLNAETVEKFSNPPGLNEALYDPMNDYEAKIAMILLQRGLIIYREIPIANNGSNADFYVINPKSRKGKLVEVTLMSKHYKSGDRMLSARTRQRKARQLKLLKATGMPFVVLYKTNLELMKKYIDANLFE